MKRLSLSILSSMAAASAVFSGCLSVGSTGTDAVPAGTPLVSVDAGAPVGPVNRLVYGHNMEAADSRGIFNVPFNAKPPVVTGQGLWNCAEGKSYPEIAGTVKSLGIGMMRYPGGCLAHNYDWRQAAGPRAERPNWPFGIDEYMQLCRDMGAEPLFTVADYTLPLEQMPEHAAGLVEYLNAPATPEHPWAMKRKEGGHPEPYGVKWFELGNETDHGNHKCVPRRCYSPDEYVVYAKSCAAAMRKVDPSVKIGVVTKPGNGEDFDCKWNMTIYKEACPIADFLIVHFYGPCIGGTDAEGSYKSCMAYADQLERYMASYRKLCLEGCDRELPLAVTEYNIGHSTDAPIAYRYSFTAGLLCADMMRLYLKPSSKVANAEYWQVVNGWWGMFYTKDASISKRRATLPFYQLWGAHFGGLLLEPEVKGSPRFDAPAAGGLPASKGDAFKEKAKIRDVALDKLDFSSLKQAGVEVLGDSPESLIFSFKGLSKESYLGFSNFAKPEKGAISYQLSFEARFAPASKDGPTATLGLSLLDSRGWGKTQSGIAVDNIEKAKDWTAFKGVFNALEGCPGVSVLLRVPGVSSPLSGTLEIRNLKVEAFSPERIPAYEGLTAASSLSDDGATLHLILFNKSFDKEIEPAIFLKGFKAASAETWTVVQDKVETIDYKEPLKGSLPIPSGDEALRVKLPPHSMTAIDFVRRN